MLDIRLFSILCVSGLYGGVGEGNMPQKIGATGGGCAKNGLSVSSISGFWG